MDRSANPNPNPDPGNDATNNPTNEHVVRLQLDAGDLVTHFPTAAVASKWVEKIFKKTFDAFGPIPRSKVFFECCKTAKRGCHSQQICMSN